MLTQSELKELFTYCPNTGLFTRLKSVSPTGLVGDISGCKRPDGYIVIQVNSKLFRAQRLAWLYMHGEFPVNNIDHVNGIKHDNRIVNLRDVTNAGNMQNQRKARDDNKSSGLLGVTWHKSRNKWKSAIKLNGKSIHIGLFHDKHKAHNAYLAKKREIHSTCTI